MGTTKITLEVLREDGVLVSLLGRVGWVYGRILCGVRRSFVVSLDLRWEMTPRLDFGKIFGVGYGP